MFPSSLQTCFSLSKFIENLWSYCDMFLQWSFLCCLISGQISIWSSFCQSHLSSFNCWVSNPWHKEKSKKKKKMLNAMLKLIINIYYVYQSSVYVPHQLRECTYICHFYGGKFPTCQQPKWMASCKADFLHTLDNTVAN